MEVLEELRRTGRAAIAGSASLHRALLDRLLRREGPQ
jgi:hypothetical protein